MAVGGWANPDKFIGRRDPDRLDAANNSGIGNAFTLLVVVTERRARPLPPVTWRCVAHIAKTFFGYRGRNLGRPVNRLSLFCRLSQHRSFPLCHANQAFE